LGITENPDGSIDY